MKGTFFTAVLERCRQDADFRNRALILIILLGIYVLIIPDFLWKQSAEKDLSRLTGKYREFSVLANEYRSLSARVQRIEKKKTLTEAKGIAQVIGEMAESLGMKGEVKSIKETGRRKTLEQMREETAEIQLEKVNMTEMMNLLYKVENAPMILVVKKVAIKKSFESPELLDMTMILSLFVTEKS